MHDALHHVLTTVAASGAHLYFGGYTLYMPVLSTFASLPGAAPNLPIQLPRDFTAIGFAAENPMFIVVTPSLGIKNLPDLIARAKIGRAHV